MQRLVLDYMISIIIVFWFLPMLLGQEQLENSGDSVQPEASARELHGEVKDVDLFLVQISSTLHLNATIHSVEWFLHVTVT